MGESSGSVSIDVERISFGGKEHLIQTRCGSVSVSVFGDQEKPALVTYPDVALNYMSCFQGLFFTPEAASLLLHNFCIYHITPPGHESSYSLELLLFLCTCQCLLLMSWQIKLQTFLISLAAVMCMGVTAGAYILTLFASRYQHRVIGLMLVSPFCKAPSWTEWFYNKEVRGNTQEPESDIVQACRSLLDERQSMNVWRFLQSMNGRHDLTEELKKLHCRTLIFVGDSSPFHSDAIHMISKLDRRYSALVEVQVCGSLVTEEQPHAMFIPMEYFLMGYGLYRPCQLSLSPRSPLSPSCISPDLYSPESMGVKLKPIKTRIALKS